jgi:spermidine synthase
MKSILPPEIVAARRSRFLALFLGGVASASQILLLREFLSIVGGNELAVGITLALWMILTAAGAIVGGRLPAPTASGMLRRSFLIVLLPAITILLLRATRGLLFPPGVTLEFLPTLALPALFLAPFCVTSGVFFAGIVRLRRAEEAMSPLAEIYGWEGAGSVLGASGVYVLAMLLNNTLSASLFLAACSGVILVIFRRRFEKGSRWMGAAVGAILIAVAASLIVHVDRVSRGWLHKGEEILLSSDTPFGSLVVTRTKAELNFFGNGVLLFSTGEVVTCEEAVHFAMVQRSHPRHVLLISGAASGTLAEAHKYAGADIDYVEENPGVMRAGLATGTLPASWWLHSTSGDARRFLRTSTVKFDAVISQIPEPVSVQSNRFFTREFFAEAAACMTDSGVISVSMFPAVEYLGPEARGSASTLLKTMRAVFPYVIVLPGEKYYFLASRAPLSTHIGELVQQRGVPTRAVNSFYIDDELLARRSAVFMAELNRGAEINEDFRPIACYQQLSLWLSAFGPPPLLIALAVGCLGLLSAFAAKPLGAVVFASGCAVSGFEVILLIGFQAMCGYLYQTLAIIVAACMAGLAAGSLHARRGEAHAARLWGSYAAVTLAGVLLALLLPMVYHADMAGNSGVAFFSLAAAIAGYYGGMVFGLTSRTKSAGERSRGLSLYSWELAGAALGAVATSVFLIPLVGITSAGMCITLFCAAAGLVAFLRLIMQQEFQTT